MDKELKLRTKKSHLEAFKCGIIWQDMLTILNERIKANKDALCNPDVNDIKEVKFYQGAIHEINVLMELPSMMLDYIEDQTEEEQTKENL